MCNTNWCFGDCEECLAEERWEKEQEESNSECPHRRECNWVVTDTKNDKCTTCGKTYTYS